MSRTSRRRDYSKISEALCALSLDQRWLIQQAYAFRDLYVCGADHDYFKGVPDAGTGQSHLRIYRTFVRALLSSDLLTPPVYDPRDIVEVAQGLPEFHQPASILYYFPLEELLDTSRELTRLGLFRGQRHAMIHKAREALETAEYCMRELRGLLEDSSAHETDRAAMDQGVTRLRDLRDVIIELSSNGHAHVTALLQGTPVPSALSERTVTRRPGETR